MKKCVKCNTPLEPGETKCSYCGLDVKVGDAQRKLDRAKNRANRRLHPGVSGSESGLSYAAKVLLIASCALYVVIVLTSLASLITISVNNAAAEFAYLVPRFIGFTIAGFVGIAVGIPVTVYYIRMVKNGYPVSLTFKICCLLLVNRIAGILMLCDTSN